MKAWRMMGAVVVLAAAAGAAEAAELRIKDAAARVNVIPEARGDVHVSVTPGAARLPQVLLRQEGGALVADGQLERRIEGCRGFNISLNGDGGQDRRRMEDESVSVRGVGRVRVQDLPLITARVPLNAVVAMGGAVFGSIGPTQSLSLSHAGCGDVTAGNVAGPLKVNSAGSGDVQVGASRRAEVNMAGSGDVRLGPVAGPLSAAVAGSGDIVAASVEGAVDARIAGSGDIRVDGPRTGPVSASIVGSGDVRVAGLAESVQASIMGSGDVRVARVAGPVNRSVRGSGDVVVGP